MTDLLTQFKEFVASKPADEEYNSLSTKDCALAQFGKHLYGDRFACAAFDFFIINKTLDQSGPTETIDLFEGMQNYEYQHEFQNTLSHSTTFGEIVQKLAHLDEVKDYDNPQE